MIKYFRDNEYILGKKDCWTLIQDIFKDKHNIILPDIPMCINQSKLETTKFIKANVILKPLIKAKKGAIVHYSKLGLSHIGYCLNNKQFIHKCVNGVFVENIKNDYKIYEVVGTRWNYYMT